MSESTLLRRRRARRWRSPALLIALGMVASMLAIGSGAIPAAAAGPGAMPAGVPTPTAFPPPAAGQCPAATAGITGAPSGPATVAMRPGPAGPMLVVGSGPNAGCSLYILTADQPQASPPSYGCGAAGNCDTKIWPALLTNGRPMAGPGVNPRLLGMVARTDVLTGMTVMQVTYAGMPLYQFSHDTAPGMIAGESIFDQFTSPPGVWYLVSARQGAPLPGVATLAMENVTFSGGASGSGVVLGALMPTDFGGARLFPVYTFSADPAHGTACTGKCAVFWPPLLTQARPQAATGVDARALGVIRRPDGSMQVTYDGRPLYLFIKDNGPTTAPGTASGVGAGAIFGGTGFNTVPAQ